MNATTNATKNSAPKFSDRVRFNWGFHDGTREAQNPKMSLTDGVRDMSTHFDRAYAAGYLAGVADFRATGERCESSDAAWAAK